jgi:hypothetical protein
MRTLFPLNILLFMILMTMGSCGLVPKLGCDLKMTGDYIESTCGLYNGVRFEELKVDSFYDDNTPRVYKVVAAFKGRLDESKTKNLNRIYFNDPSGKYLWWTDTTPTGIYRKTGIYRERIDIRENIQTDTLKEVEVVITADSVVRYSGKLLDNLENYSSEIHFVCPVKFKPGTWYYLNFYSQQYEAYLYVDKNMSYRIDQINLPTNF